MNLVYNLGSVRILNIIKPGCDICERELKPNLDTLMFKHPDWRIDFLDEMQMSGEQLEMWRITSVPVSIFYVNNSPVCKVDGVTNFRDFESIVENIMNDQGCRF